MTPPLTSPRPYVVVAGLVLLPLLASCGGGGSTSASTSATSGPGMSSSAPAGAAGPSGAPNAGADQAPVPVESNPPGDIPDNLAFVPYRNTTSGYSFTHPEGWARTESGSRVDFTDKLNGIAADVTGSPADVTLTAAKASLPTLEATQPAFEFRKVREEVLPAGRAIHLTYRRNSAPDPVTGRQVRDEVESYLVTSGDRFVRLDLYGPVGADNVDAYRTISQSLKLS